MGAAELRDQIAAICQQANECLQPRLRRSMPVEYLDRVVGALDVRVDDRSDERVLALEVVVDVAERYVGGFGDVGQGGLLDALAVDELRRSVDEAIALARSRAARLGYHL